MEALRLLIYSVLWVTIVIIMIVMAVYFLLIAIPMIVLTIPLAVLFGLAALVSYLIDFFG